MKIIFICRHNRFRSKVGEAFFKKYNESKKIMAISRGVFRDKNVPNVVFNAMKKRGVIVNRESRVVSRQEVLDSDLIVNVADDVPSKLFKGKKVLNWNISDTDIKDVKGINKRIDKIEKKVKKLVKKLNKKA